MHGIEGEKVSRGSKMSRRREGSRGRTRKVRVCMEKRETWMRRRMTSMWPFPKARWSGASPFLFCALMLAFDSRRNSTAAADPV
jgi:hypothetical protein